MADQPQEQQQPVQFEDYFYIPGLSFRCVGLNPYFENKVRATRSQKLFARILFHGCFWLLSLCLIMEIAFIISVAGDMDRFLDCCRAGSCSLFGLLGVEKMLFTAFDGQKFNTFINVLEDMFPKDLKTQRYYKIGEHSAFIIGLIKKLTACFFLCIFVWVVGSPTLELIICYYTNTKWELELPFDMLTPWQPDTPFLFAVTFFMEFVNIYTVVVIILAVNIFLTAVVTQISLQFDMLAQNIRELPPNDVPALNELVETHNRLIEIGTTFAELISRTAFMNHFLNSLTLCLSMFQIVTSPPLERFRFVTSYLCILLHTGNLSWIGNILSDHVSAKGFLNGESILILSV